MISLLKEAILDICDHGTGIGYANVTGTGRERGMNTEHLPAGHVTVSSITEGNEFCGPVLVEDNNSITIEIRGKARTFLLDQVIVTRSERDL